MKLLLMREILLSSMGLLSSCVPHPDPEKNTNFHLLMKQILKNLQRSCEKKTFADETIPNV